MEKQSSEVESIDVETNIAKLVSRSYGNYYNPEDVFDWAREAVVPPEVTTEMYRDSISQLYHAERFAVKLCTQTSLRMDDEDSKNYLLVQALEESRHARLYEKYTERFGAMLPVNPAMAEIYDQVINWNGHPIATILALNFFIEGEAIHQQSKRIRTLPCPLFRDINKLIIKDEARHHAFGSLYVKKFLNTVPKEELQEILSWIKVLWIKWECNNEERYQEDTAGVLRNDSTEIESRFSQHLQDLHKMGIVLG